MELASILPFIAIAVLFWFLLIRPQARRQKEQARMQAAIQPGQRVMLTSGIYGTVRGGDDDGDTLILEVADGVVLEVARAAVATVVRADEETSTDPATGENPAGTEEI